MKSLIIYAYLFTFVVILLFGCSKKEKPLTPDTTPPGVKSVVSFDTTKVLISFDESVKTETAVDTMNYMITSYETLDVHLVDIDPMKINCILQTEPQESTFYELSIKNIKDMSGNVMKDTSFTFFGIGVPVDSFPPNIWIIEPCEGDTLYGFEYFSVNTSDNTGIKKVSFFINDSLLAIDKDFPYYSILDVRNLTEGDIYKIYALAEDYSANVGHSGSLDVFIGYHPPFPYVVLDAIYTGKIPYRADKTEDGTKIFFVQIHNWSQPPIDDLVMFSTETNSIEKMIHFTTGGSYFLDVFENSWVYFTTGNSFSIYDILLEQIIETVAVGGTPQGIVRSNNEKLYIARNSKEDILVYSLQQNSVIDSIPVPGEPVALAIDTNNNELYACLNSENLITVIDTEIDTVITNISISGYPFEVIFSPVYDRAYVTELDNSLIGVIETFTHTLLDEISPFGLINPKGMAITDDGEYLFITGMNDKVFVINTFDYSIEWSFELGMYPWSIVYIPLYDRMYVVCMGDTRIYCIGD
ncbi:hypothetical protein KAU34_05150 [candidate division WOR-3 bacterium]|nr:hypothetical protein [candidate division WOR-3 bacterium]